MVKGELLFLSDCHLDARRPQMIEMLAGFLRERAAAAARVYILGDLFEAWLGDDDDSTDYDDVIDALSDLRTSAELYFMAGNRDFLVGEDFARRVGLTLLSEPCSIQLGDSHVVLVHGDSLCTDDHDYQAFRSMVRNPAWQTEFLAKPLSERQQIAAELRRNSAAAMRQKTSDIMDVNETTVAELFDQSQADIIVHGHTHRPAVHQYPAGRQRLVLGDWVEAPSYLSWSESRGFELIDPRVVDA